MIEDQKLPSGWLNVRLGDIAEVRLGRQRSPDKATGAHMRPYLRAANVTWHGIDLSDVKQMNFDPSEVTIYRLLPGDILLGEASGSASEVGKPAVWEGQIEDCCFQNTLIRVRTEKALSPWFLLHFTWNARSGAFAEASKGIGIHHLGREALFNWRIYLPPQGEQRRIVDKVHALQVRSRKAREALDAIPALLENFRQSVLAAAFRGDLTADWRAKNQDIEPASKLLDQIREGRRRKWEQTQLAKMTAKETQPKIDSWKGRYEPASRIDAIGLPPLPKSWQWASAEECAWEITVGYVGPMQTSYAPKGIPFLRSQNVRKNRFDPDGLKYISPAFHTQLSKSRLFPGDLVIVRSGAPGTACYIPDHLQDANCSDLVITRFVDLINPELISFYINSTFVKNMIKDEQVGVAQQHFNIGSMRKLALPVIPLTEQTEINRLIRTMNKFVDQLEENMHALLERLPHLDERILEKTFRGNLVPQDPSDEPATALLARIRAESIASDGQSRPRREPRPQQTTNNRASSSDNTPGDDGIPIPVDSTPDLPVATAELGPTKPPTDRCPIEDYTTDEMMSHFRAASRGGDTTEDDLLRSVLLRLGYERLGPKVTPILKGHLKAAVGRGIIEREGFFLRCATPTIKHYDAAFLMKSLTSVMRKDHAHERDEVIQALTAHLGYSAVSDAMRETMKTLFNSAIRQGLLARDGKLISRTA